jgi:hypothetical protein
MWPASAAAQEHSAARSSPARAAASGTSLHSASARSRWASASAMPNTATASRAAATDAASASGAWPAAAQCGASSAAAACPASRSASRAARRAARRAGRAAPPARRAGWCRRRPRPAGRGASAVRPDQQHRPVSQVVREEDDQVERRRVRPVQVFQHQQRRRALAEPREDRLEHAQLRARSALGQPAQRLGERLVRQLGADEIEAASHQHLEARGSRRQLGREPSLADAGLAGDQHGGSVAGARSGERALERGELAGASDEHRAQYPRVRTGGQADRPPGRRR